MISRIAVSIMAIMAAIAGLSGGMAEGSDPVTNNGVVLPCDMNSKIDARGVPWTHWGWQKHGVLRLNGTNTAITVPAELLFIGGEWEYNNSQMPYIVYMPEKKRLMLGVSVDKPDIKGAKVFSDDFGKTWTKPTWIHTDAAGNPDLGAATQLTYLVNGKLIIGIETQYWASTDYGQTWSVYAPVPKASDGRGLYQWDPMLVDRDPKTGKVVRLVETRYKDIGHFGTADYYSQGNIRFSADEGKTWSKDIDVPQWKGINEVVLCRAKNGDIVAACRLDNPPQYYLTGNDQYSGLAVSISKDNGYTWSEPNILFHWGRHHPHVILMPNGDLVMSYVIRNGYKNTKDGQGRFGIEAVVSKDNGKTWDLDNRYILASNTSPMTGDRYMWGSPQSTSNALLPDGSILTTFCTGVRNVPSQTIWLMDTAIVKWKPSTKAPSADRTYRDADYKSDTRNLFDLDGVKW